MFFRGSCELWNVQKFMPEPKSWEGDHFFLFGWHLFRGKGWVWGDVHYLNLPIPSNISASDVWYDANLKGIYIWRSDNLHGATVQQRLQLTLYTLKKIWCSIWQIPKKIRSICQFWVIYKEKHIVQYRLLDHVLLLCKMTWEIQETKLW